MEEVLQEYVNTVNKYPFWAAFDKDNCIGFFPGKYIINHYIIAKYKATEKGQGFS
jgi:hypothetical protein